MSDQLRALLEYAQADGRICPMPLQWQELWEMLPQRERKGGGWEPSLPLILGAWATTPAGSKSRRLREHILWAAEHGALQEVDSFLRSLPEDQWARIRKG